LPLRREVKSAGRGDATSPKERGFGGERRKIENSYVKETSVGRKSSRNTHRRDEKIEKEPPTDERFQAG